MVQPLTFGYDELTAQTNSFQAEPTLARSEVLRRVNEEFNIMVDGLRAQGIYVHVYIDTDADSKPNAVFPNNWLSTWPNGDIFHYPMATTSRRVERRSDLLQQLEHQFKINSVIDLSGSEQQGQHLESTGVMIFDHIHKVVYGCVSDRCDEQLFNQHAKVLGYQPIVFHAYNTAGSPIYHTNVMMGLQSNTAVICAESIRSESERSLVLACLRATGRTVVEITYDQMAAFCGNVLELRSEKGDYYLAMSQSAYDNFTIDERNILAQDKVLLPFLVPTIEAVGGGSVRCMLAELFLPRIDVAGAQIVVTPTIDMIK